jgi:hypothetical protein
MRHTMNMMSTRNSPAPYAAKCEPSPTESMTLSVLSIHSTPNNRRKWASAMRRPTKSVQDSKLSHRYRGINDGIDHRLVFRCAVEHYARCIDTSAVSPARCAVNLHLPYLHIVDVP